MKTIIALLAVAAGVSLASSASAMDVKSFLKTYSEAEKASKASGKPMYLHFTTTWCTWCRTIEQEVYTSPSGDAALKDFIPATLDCTVEEGKAPAGLAKVNLDLMDRLGGSGFPFLVMVTPEGAVLGTIDGYVPIDVFVKELVKAETRLQELRDLEKAAPTMDRAGLEYNRQAMTVYANVRLWDKAKAAAEIVRKLDPGNKEGDVRAVLVLLKASAGTPAKDATAEKAQSAALDGLWKEILRLDPANEFGVLEEAAEVFTDHVMARPSTPGLEDRKHWEEALGVLDELTTGASALKDAQIVWANKGQLYGMLGQLDLAREAFEKSLAANPTSPLAPRLKGIIDQIKQAAAPQPAAGK